MFNLQKLERPASPKPIGGGARPNQTAAVAPGDGKVKTRGTALWPQKIRTPCAQYEAGEPCDAGALCRRFCYLTKNRASFSN